MKRRGRIRRLAEVLIIVMGTAFIALGCEKSPAPPPVTMTKRVKAKTENIPSPQNAASVEKRPVFAYNPKGLTDPFKPFIQIGSPGPVVKGVPRTPLQEYDLSQLTLTAIVWLGESKSRAMVRDSAGKGFTVKKGTYIGKRGGRVKAIHMDRLVIEEPVRLYGDETNLREVEMKMPSEGGKK